MNPKVKFLIAIILLAWLAACQNATPAATDLPAATPAPTLTRVPTHTPSPAATPTPAFVWKLEDVQKAVIRIGEAPLAPGWDGAPEFGYGAGVIIDPGGLALTAYSVVAGTAEVDVWWMQSDGEPVQMKASVIGYSECANLALLQLAASAPLPYLSWREEPLLSGSHVFSAGYSPLHEYVLLPGLVSVPTNSGATPRTAVEMTIKHNAIAGESSLGGPLVDDQGKLVGINVSLNPMNNRGLALPQYTVTALLPNLQAGEKLGIGILPIALAPVGDFWQPGGVVVGAVSRGSPAEKAGLQAGDILLFANQPLPEANFETVHALAAQANLGSEHNLAAYCRDLPVDGSNQQPIDVVLLRTMPIGLQKKYTGLVVCTGRINGGRVQCSSTPQLHFPFDNPSELTDWSLSSPPDKISTQLIVPEIVDRALLIANTSGNAIGNFIYQGLQTSDVQLETHVIVYGGFTRTALICRYARDEQGNESWYEFQIFDSGEWEIGKTLNGKYFVLRHGGSKALINYPINDNRLLAACQGNQLSLFINDVLAGTVTDEDLTHGMIGIGYHTTQATRKAFFKYLTISQP